MIESQQTTTAFNIEQGKNSLFNPQLKTIYNFLLENVATASMVAKSKGIPHKNITRYKRDLEKAGLLWEVKHGTCKITGFKAYYLSTNFKIAHYQQYSLFSYED